MKKDTSKLQSTRKLQLHRETLRHLEPRDLRWADGAEPDAVDVGKPSWPPHGCAY